MELRKQSVIFNSVNWVLRSGRTIIRENKTNIFFGRASHLLMEVGARR